MAQLVIKYNYLIAASKPIVFGKGDILINVKIGMSFFVSLDTSCLDIEGT